MDEEKITAAEESGIPLIVRILSALFKRTVTKFDKVASSHWERQDIWARAAFAGMNRMNIPIEKFIYLIYAGLDCSPSCFVAAFIYIDRFINLYPSIIIDSLNVHGLFITAILAAVKFFDKRCIGLKEHLANLARISPDELNNLEKEFLFRLKFDLFITEDTYQFHCSRLLNEMKTLFPKPRPQIPSRDQIRKIVIRELMLLTESMKDEQSGHIHLHFHLCDCAHKQ